ncbi:hypothetical protein LCGC14_2478330, partial [marine sediment metagenome]
LYGVITDATTGLAVPGVSIQLEGTPSIGGLPTPATTDSNGYYLFEDLTPDSYIIIFEKEDYITLTGTLDIIAGNNEVNTTMTSSVIAPSLANLYGVITDNQSGNPISGVSVTVNGNTDLTDVNGRYSFEDLTIGSYVITLEKEDYATATLSITLLEGNNELDLTMAILSLSIVQFSYLIMHGYPMGPYLLTNIMVNGEVFVIGFRVNNPTAVAISCVTVAFEVGGVDISSPVYHFPPPGDRQVVTPPFTVSPGMGGNENYFFFSFTPTAPSYTGKAEVFVDGVLVDTKLLAFSVVY